MRDWIKRGEDCFMRELREKYLSTAEGLKNRLTAMSDDFFRKPELGLEEERTSAMMQEALKEAGFSIDSGVAGMKTAFKASFGSGSPRIALLAEMDALPGIGHGCGHNIAGMASVGAGIALARTLSSRLKPGEGTILVLGTPAEELGKGKLEMIKAGIFDGVDASMMVHGSSRRTVLKHFLERLNFTFSGKASHARPILRRHKRAGAVILLFNSIGLLRQHSRSDVRIHGIITDGGRKPNIIPERAAASFYVRANDLKELASIKERVINCARGAATVAISRPDHASF
jgi:amidohydrolase